MRFVSVSQKKQRFISLIEALHLDFSPIKGPEGNIEYLLHLKNHPGGFYDNSGIPDKETVRKAHETLDH